MGIHLLALVIGNLSESTQRTSCKLIWELNMSQQSDSAATKKQNTILGFTRRIYSDQGR